MTKREGMKKDWKGKKREKGRKWIEGKCWKGGEKEGREKKMGGR